MTSELQGAVEGLINPIRMRIYREDTKRHEWTTLPSLWDQLGRSSQWGSQEAGGSKFGSRPVISTNVVSLVIDITQAATETTVELVGTTRGNTPDNLRAIAANLEDAELIFWWTEKLHTWVGQARGALRLDPPRPRSARDTACPDCGEKHAYTQQDGETIRVPALAVTWVGPTDNDYHADDEWKVRAVECRQCQAAWFRGDSMDELIGRMLEANRTQETMTDGAA